MKNYAIFLDLEGVHGVVGEPYKGLEDIPDYNVAAYTAVTEVNAAVRALFDEGADNVYVWDNHGGGGNIDFTKVDPRAKKIEIKNNPLTRIDFIKPLDLSGVVYLGYHAREGTLNAILAHTYSSSDIQYYKFDGKLYGEFDMDCVFCSAYGVPALFAASDDICVKQMLENSPHIETVVTKIALGRNKAKYLDDDKVLQDIYNGVRKSVNKKHDLYPLSFPCTIEVRYTRMELAEFYYERNTKEFGIKVDYKEDAHTLTAKINNIDELRMFL